ncbi:unnamed protein product [Diplocarpon coronariae]|nr:hypothetical protein JHW43_004343 [Diplocarpon mali]
MTQQHASRTPHAVVSSPPRGAAGTGSPGRRGRVRPSRAASPPSPSPALGLARDKMLRETSDDATLCVFGYTRPPASPGRTDRRRGVPRWSTPRGLTNQPPPLLCSARPRSQSCAGKTLQAPSPRTRSSARDAGGRGRGTRWGGEGKPSRAEPAGSPDVRVVGSAAAPDESRRMGGAEEGEHQGECRRQSGQDPRLPGACGCGSGARSISSQERFRRSPPRVPESDRMPKTTVASRNQLPPVSCPRISRRRDVEGGGILGSRMDEPSRRPPCSQIAGAATGRVGGSRALAPSPSMRGITRGGAESGLSCLV